MEIAELHHINKSKTTLGLAKEVLLIEARAIEALANRLNESFDQAVDLILHCRGRIVVSGMGKSGHIARKIAATFASTGSPAFFMHPAEASHGDLGMITGDDVVIALSHSGESNELITILPLIKRMGAKLIAITGNANSSIAKASNIHLDAYVSQEACPLGLAPTASTTVALALGDALAVTVLNQRGFSADDFARSHPGGSLGRRLLVHVADVMRRNDAVPMINQNAIVSEGLLEMSKKGLGMTAVVDDKQKLIGIFTDGDLRRAFEDGIDIKATLMKEVMHSNPKTISEDKLAAEAVELMESRKISALLVTNTNGDLIGALNMLDLLIAKVV